MIPILLLLLSALVFADPRITYIKSFPGSTPAYVEISVDGSGAANYKESADDDDPEIFQLEAAEKAAIFDLADRLEHFSHPLESGLKVANMGAKTLRWQDGAQKYEAKFNYSTDDNAKALQDWFERITESERLLATLQRVVRHDKLGVNDAVLEIQNSWDRKRLVSPGQFLPLLDQVAKNEIYMHMSRERAARIADAIRASKSKSE